MRHSIRKTLNGVLHLLLRQLWDGAIIKRTPIIYSKTFDHGEMSLKFSGERSATFELTGWPTIPEYDCVGLAEGIIAVLEISGRVGVVVSWEKNGDDVFFNAEWAQQ